MEQVNLTFEGSEVQRDAGGYSWRGKRKARGESDWTSWSTWSTVAQVLKIDSLLWSHADENTT